MYGYGYTSVFVFVETLRGLNSDVLVCVCNVRILSHVCLNICCMYACAYARSGERMNTQAQSVN